MAEDRAHNKWKPRRSSLKEKMRRLPKEAESTRTKPDLITRSLLMNFIRIVGKDTKSQGHLDEWAKEERNKSF